jgi:hypothetical protein
MIGCCSGVTTRWLLGDAGSVSSAASGIDVGGDEVVVVATLDGGAGAVGAAVELGAEDCGAVLDGLADVAVDEVDATTSVAVPGIAGVDSGPALPSPEHPAIATIAMLAIAAMGDVRMRRSPLLRRHSPSRNGT